MASSKEYLGCILEQLSDLDDVSYRAMMGEYIIYCRGKVVGGIYDDRFLVKPTKSAQAMMPDAEMELPYEGAKKMLLVDGVENREFLAVEWSGNEGSGPSKGRAGGTVPGRAGAVPGCLARPMPAPKRRGCPGPAMLVRTGRGPS